MIKMELHKVFSKNKHTENNMENKNVDISIIIPALNEEKNIINLLKDITKQRLIYRRKKLGLEIIVADAGSKDKTREISKKFGATIVQGGLPSKGRNNGAKLSKGNLLFTIDADVRMRNPSFLVKAYDEFTRKKLDCAAVINKPIVNNIRPKTKKRLIQAIYNIGNIYVWGLQKTKYPRAIGTCMIFRRSSFMKVKGFNEKLYYGEDCAIAKKFVTKGYKFRILSPSLFIEMSPRRLLNQGTLNFVKNVLVLDLFVNTKNGVSSKKFRKLTNLENHFENSKYK